MAKEIKFVPSAVKTGRLEGHVILRKPSFDEKYGYLSEVGLDLDESGKAAMPTEAKARIEMIRKLVEISRKHYVAVELMVKETGEKLSSLEDLEYGDCEDVLIEVGAAILSGFRVGNG